MTKKELEEELAHQRKSVEFHCNINKKLREENRTLKKGNKELTDVSETMALYIDELLEESDDKGREITRLGLAIINMAKKI